MTIKFCGAAREVTGSCHLITLNSGFQILLDCGLYQGRAEHLAAFNQEWLFDPASIQAFILSHAHIDHAGRVPKLVKDGYQGPIFATHATRSLANIMLLDSAMIQEREVSHHRERKHKNRPHDEDPLDPLYTTLDVKKTLEQFRGYPYEQWFRIHDQVEVLFRDAGHILGSASVTLRIEEDGQTKMLGFTGDIGRPARPILRDPQPMPPVDWLICESTYGDREHEQAPAELDKLIAIIQETCVEKGGKLIIPAFSVGRTQEIVYLLDQLAAEQRLPRVPVYVDSPLAVNATVVFGSHPECFDEELSTYLLTDPNPFGFNNLHYLRKTEDSKALNERSEACIIISSAGMINAGRIKHHVFHNIDDPRCTILLVGYCSPETPGGRLRRGDETLRLFGEIKPVRARIEIMDSFSAHADKLEMLEFLRNQREGVKEIFLVHGDYEVQQNFSALLQQFGFAGVKIPALGDTFEC